MSIELTESQKLDVLLKFTKEYNLKEVADDPATYTMSCGGGYTLFASVNRSWFFQFKDGITTETYDIEASRVPFTNARDARKLYKKYDDECKKLLKELKGETSMVEAEVVVETQVINPKFDPVLEEKNRLEREENERRLAAMEAGEIKTPECKPVARPQRKIANPGYENVTQSRANNAVMVPDNVRSKQISALTQDDIKNYLCPTATDQETYLFLQLCQARNLNPFLNEAYLIKFGNKATMVVGKETFTRRAEQHPQFDGYEAGVIVQTAEGLDEREGTFVLKNETLLGGYAKVYRKDRTRPIISKVPLAEYDSGQSLWKTKPATMIRKVALVQALRESFACELSGMYDASEMNVIEAVYEVQA